MNKNPKKLSEIRTEAYSFFKEVLKKNYSAEKDQFFAKIGFNKAGQEVIAMFAQELKKDFFVELYKKNNETDEIKPLNPSRILFHWTHHNHLEEYEVIESTENLDKRWLIPIKELKEVSTYIEQNDDDDIDFDSGPATPIENDDIPQKKITLSDESLKDLYAIIHLKPVSNKDWLNNLIQNNNE